LILIRGGGDLATGVAIRLLRSGLKVVVTELPQPLAVRRSVAFSEAIYKGQASVEGFIARRVQDAQDILRVLNILSNNQIPLLVDPLCASAKLLHPAVIVDARLTKLPPEPIGFAPLLYIGLGPGFLAPSNCQAAIETRRGHDLGRVYWDGGPALDTALPEGDSRRVLRSPADGKLTTYVDIGQVVDEEALIADVCEHHIKAPFRGLLRGLLRSKTQVSLGMKIGDIDHRIDPALCTTVSDKSLAIGGGVLEAILSHTAARKSLWD